MPTALAYSKRVLWDRPRQWQRRQRVRWVIWVRRRLRMIVSLTSNGHARMERVETVDISTTPPVYTVIHERTRMERRSVKKPGESTGGLGVGVKTKVFDKAPNLLLHCAMLQYSDGSARQPGYLQIRTNGDQWQVTAVDLDAKAILRAEDASIDIALATLEALMGDSSTPWIQAPWLERGPRKKGK